MIYTSLFASPVGDITLAQNSLGLIGVGIAGQKHSFNAAADEIAEKETPLLLSAMRWLDVYFSGHRPQPLDIPLAPEGSAFRLTIWNLLREIPYGDVTTYGSLALKAAHIMGKAKMSAQAVGGAVGHNPISVIIPCHRVIGADGSLTGYDGGTDIKYRLLALEGVDMSRFSLPGKAVTP